MVQHIWRRENPCYDIMMFSLVLFFYKYTEIFQRGILADNLRPTSSVVGLNQVYKYVNQENCFPPQETNAI